MYHRIDRIIHTTLLVGVLMENWHDRKNRLMGPP